MRIGCFNVEKNGQSSENDKQIQVDRFIDACCQERGWGADIVFLSEIHNARADDYLLTVNARYHNYRAQAFPGGGIKLVCRYRESIRTFRNL